MGIRSIFLSFFKLLNQGRGCNEDRGDGSPRRASGTACSGSLLPNPQEKLDRVMFKETVLKLTQVGE